MCRLTSPGRSWNDFSFHDRAGDVGRHSRALVWRLYLNPVCQQLGERILSHSLQLGLLILATVRRNDSELHKFFKNWRNFLNQTKCRRLEPLVGFLSKLLTIRVIIGISYLAIRLYIYLHKLPRFLCSTIKLFYSNIKEKRRRNLKAGPSAL